MEVLVPQPLQALGRQLGELRDQLDAVHLGPELQQDRALVSRTCADLQYPMPRFQVQQIGHESDDIGLGNGLSVTDR
jgi:hypothetical protein